VHELTDSQLVPGEAIPLHELLVANMDADWRAAQLPDSGDGWLCPYRQEDDIEHRRQDAARRHTAWQAEARRVVDALPPGPRSVVLHRGRWWIICAAAPASAYVLPGAAALEAR
jgi:hypothetical protein